MDDILMAKGRRVLLIEYPAQILKEALIGTEKTSTKKVLI